MADAAGLGAAEGVVRPAPAHSRQLLAVVVVEMRRLLLGPRAIPLYGLALLPIGMTAIAGMFGAGAHGDITTVAGSTAVAREHYGFIYSGMILGAGAYFGGALVFARSFRGELLDRTLHFAMLTPMPRSLLLFAKFLGGLLAAWLLFGGATVISFTLMYLPLGVEVMLEDLVGGGGAALLGQYCAAVLMACLAYGAVFLLLGLAVKNPVAPIAALALWEAVQSMMPANVKLFSVSHYLRAFAPAPPVGPAYEVLTVAPPIWQGLLGIGVIVTVALALATLRARRLQVSYVDD